MFPFPGKRGYLYIFGAATIWGTFPAFAKTLYSLKAPVLAVASARTVLAFLIILIILSIRKKVYLKVAAKDLPFMALYGLVGVSLFNFFFLYTIDIATTVMAIFLLFSAPIFVTLIARLVLHEPLVKLKLVALGSSIIGLAMLVEAYQPASLKASALAIMTGLGSGLTFAWYSIFGKMAVGRYSHWTILLYTTGFGAFFLALFSWPQFSNLPFTFNVLSLLILMSCLYSIIAYALYVRGLRSVEASRASILTNVEPVVASLLGITFFSEHLSPLQSLGGGLVILGAILAQRD